MRDKFGHILVECPVCRKVLSGRIPKGSDGTCVFPFKHISALDGHTNPCPGTYELVDLPQKTGVILYRIGDVRSDDL